MFTSATNVSPNYLTREHNVFSYFSLHARNCVRDATINGRLCGVVLEFLVAALCSMGWVHCVVLQVCLLCVRNNCVREGNVRGRRAGNQPV